MFFLIPTGVAAPNIDCTITHAGLGINPNSNGSPTATLLESFKTKLSFEYSEVVAVIIVRFPWYQM